MQVDVCATVRALVGVPVHPPIPLLGGSWRKALPFLPFLSFHHCEKLQKLQSFHDCIISIFSFSKEVHSDIAIAISWRFLCASFPVVVVLADENVLDILAQTTIPLSWI